MKKLSSSDFDQLPIKGKGRSSALFNTIINLKIGEALLIEKKDWKRKSSPSALIRYIEKNHNMRFHFGPVVDGMGWALKRIDDKKEPIKTKEPAPVQKKENDGERFKLKSELTLFYLARIAINKIERIEDSLKAIIIRYWNADKALLQELFYEIINGLKEQGLIVVENDKTYIPLKNT